MSSLPYDGGGRDLLAASLNSGQLPDDSAYRIEAPSFADMAADVFHTNEANGWYDAERDFDDDVALLHSEVAEMFEAYRAWGFDDVTDQECNKPDHHPGAIVHGNHLCKPQGFGSEAADVLVRLLDTSHRHPAYGVRRSSLAEVETLSGFDPTKTVGGHIAALHALIAKIEPGKTTSSLHPTLVYLKTWCKHVDVDLQAEFDRKLAFNKTRGYRHGGKRV